MPLDRAVFAQRRQRLLAALGPRAAALFPAAPEAIRSNDVEYRYRQHSDFYYLTGFREPGAVCLLLPGHPTEEYVLFVRPRDQERETWTGKRAGVEGAVADFGAAAAYPIEQLDQKVIEYLADREQLYYAVERDAEFNERVLRWLQKLQATRPRTGGGPTALLDPRPILHEMRLRKGEEELACLRRAIAVSAAAHRAALHAVRPGCHEYEIEALIEYEFRRAGASAPAYPSIVASGPNATVLHYTANNRVMQEGELVLIDAGAEIDCYCADITRTVPVGVAYEGRRRAVYEMVLAAQRVALESVRPGVRIEDVHRQAVTVLAEGLVSLGLLHGSLDEIWEKELYKPFFMHRTSHWLGMDVHDAGLYQIEGESRALEPGMVLTVEPGIYIGEHLADVAEQWRGIGVRIEDDVLVTADGREVLTAAVPKEIAEVEAIRRAALGA